MKLKIDCERKNTKTHYVPWKEASETLSGKIMQIPMPERHKLQNDNKDIDTEFHSLKTFRFIGDFPLFNNSW